MSACLLTGGGRSIVIEAPAGVGNFPEAAGGVPASEGTVWALAVTGAAGGFSNLAQCGHLQTTPADDSGTVKRLRQWGQVTIMSRVSRRVASQLGWLKLINGC